MVTIQAPILLAGSLDSHGCLALARTVAACS